MDEGVNEWAELDQPACSIVDHAQAMAFAGLIYSYAMQTGMELDIAFAGVRIAAIKLHNALIDESESTP